MKTQPIRDKDKVINCLMYLQKRSTRNALLFGIAIYTGLRIGDILRLRVRDVRNKDQLVIKQQKTKNYIYLPINRELKKMIDEYTRGKNHNEYLIKSRQGYNRPITRSMAHKILKDMAYDLGIDNISCHSLRKTFGFHAYYEGGKDIALVMSILGHKDSASAIHYIGVAEADIKEVVVNLSYYDD